VTDSARLAENCEVAPDATVGATYDGWREPTVLGPGARVRSGTVVYADVRAGANLATGHGALVRERTTLGDDVLVGTDAVVDGHATLGDDVSLQTGAYVPSQTTLGDGVFLGPNATLTNDPVPLRRDDPDPDLAGPRLAADVTVGANATVLPDLDLGARAFVAAGAVVTDDVPPDSLAVGVPATVRPLPDHLAGGNR
jgi:acetyltransferase-like isoleucine patch superfamily enzyme